MPASHAEVIIKKSLLRDNDHAVFSRQIDNNLRRLDSAITQVINGVQALQNI